MFKTGKTFLVSSMKNFLNGVILGVLWALIFLSPIVGFSAELGCENEAILNHVQKDIPGIDEMTDIKKVEAIRDWLYLHSDIVASLDDYLLTYDKYPLHAMTTGEILKLYDIDKGGLFCSGIAFSLMRIYHLFGFRSWIYSYGEKGLLTHATTLVEVNRKIYIQDAYFNFSFEDDAGNPMTFYDLLEHLNKQISLKIRQDSGKRDVHIKSGTVQRHRFWPVESLAACRLLDSSHFVCELETNLDRFTVLNQDFLISTYDFLEKYGLPRDLQYLILFPFAINTDTDYITDPSQNEILRHAMSFSPRVQHELSS